MGSNLTEWVTCIKDDFKPKFSLLPRIEVYDHPLKQPVVTMTASRKILGSLPSTGSSTPITPAALLEPLGIALEGTDPLTQFAKEEMDPLSQMAIETWETPARDSKSKSERKISYDMESWSSRKIGILNKFSTSEKLSIMTSFLSDGEKVVLKAQSSAVDTVRNRLEQLDDFEEGTLRQMLDLTQQEYINRIEQLNQELVQAWNNDQRVRALKIAIQCAKLLVDTSVIQFYPSKFVLITEILDIFGKLVYDRLKAKSQYIPSGSKSAVPLPDDFTPDMVNEAAKETCRNWFYKIASIRELVPRLYVEISILKSYSYLSFRDFSEELMRLTRMIRGIGDPLVAVYTRCYLCRVGITLLPVEKNNSYLIENFYDFLTSYNQLFGAGVKSELIKQRIELSAYLTLYTPALDFILQTVAVAAPESLLVELLERCRKQGDCALLLNTIMASFKPAYIACRALQFVELISQNNEEGFPQYLLFRTLGLCLSVVPPPQEHRRQVLNSVWRIVSSLTDPAEYVSCAEVWVQYVVSHFPSREVNTFLGDLIRHMSPDRSYEKHYDQLKTILDKVVMYSQDVEVLLGLDNFLPLVDLFQQESVKVDVCKSIMNAYSNQTSHVTNDLVITNALMFICQILHDSVNALSVEDEVKQIGNLICNFIKRVDYGRDFEQQLSFYVEARGAFTNLDAVHTQLVQSVNRLSVDTRRVVKGHHTKKTGAFVRACAAYCYITIPSIASVFTKLQLYLLSGQIALFNNCLGQADACFKAALELVTEVPTSFEYDGKSRNSESFLVPYLKEFLSTLLVVPDNPERGVLYLLAGLLNVLQKYPWESQSNAHAILDLHALDVLTVAAQDFYPYHIDKVDSNDSLYGSDPKFINEINRLCTKVLEELLGHLKLLGQTEQPRRQSQLALDLFVRVTTRADLSQPQMATLAVNLWQLCQKHGQVDTKYAARTLEYVKRKLRSTGSKQILTQLHLHL